eukprot:scaffold62636_cov57-Phaeocystis_antarctica.AAC.2
MPASSRYAPPYSSPSRSVASRGVPAGDFPTRGVVPQTRERTTEPHHESSAGAGAGLGGTMVLAPNGKLSADGKCRFFLCLWSQSNLPNRASKT